MLFALSPRVRLKGQEHHAAIGRAAAKTKAGDRECAFDLGKFPGDGNDLIADLLGVFERGAGRSLDQNHRPSLIFVRNEAFRHTIEDKPGETESGEKQDQSEGFIPEESAKSAHVALSQRDHEAIKSPEKPALFTVCAAQEEGRKRWRKGQRDEC